MTLCDRSRPPFVRLLTFAILAASASARAQLDDPGLAPPPTEPEKPAAPPRATERKPETRPPARPTVEERRELPAVREVETTPPAAPAGEPVSEEVKEETKVLPASTMTADEWEGRLHAPTLF